MCVSVCVYARKCVSECACMCVSVCVGLQRKAGDTVKKIRMPLLGENLCVFMEKNYIVCCCVFM